MTQKERLRSKLLLNIMVTGILYAITVIMFVYKLYQIYWADVTLIEIQSVLLFKDLFVFGLFGLGTVAMLVSVLYYFFVPNFEKKNQILILVFSGIILLPYTIIMLIAGYMVGIDTPKYQSRNTMVSLFTFFLLIMVYSTITLQLSETVIEREPIYTQSKLYQFEYEFSESKMTFDIEVVWKEGKLIKIDMDSVANLEHPESIDPFLKEMAFFIQAENRTLCYSLIHNQLLEDEKTSCTINFPDPDYSNIELEHVDSFEDFILFVFFRDQEDGVGTETREMKLVNQEYKANYYE